MICIKVDHVNRSCCGCMHMMMRCVPITTQRNVNWTIIWRYGLTVFAGASRLSGWFQSMLATRRNRLEWESEWTCGTIDSSINNWSSFLYLVKIGMKICCWPFWLCGRQKLFIYMSHLALWIIHSCFKHANPGPFLLILFFYRRRNCRPQQDLNSGRQSRRRARWSIDHYHGHLLLVSVCSLCHCKISFTTPHTYIRLGYSASNVPTNVLSCL